jgi:hypothetical protein
MKKQVAVRQGDVLLVPTEAPADPGREVERGRVTLALGEVTGHSHVIEADGVALFENGMVWVEAPTTIQHQEHDFGATDVLRRGWYEVVRQVEEDPLAGVRRVTD